MKSYGCTKRSPETVSKLQDIITNYCFIFVLVFNSNLFLNTFSPAFCLPLRRKSDKVPSSDDGHDESPFVCDIAVRLNIGSRLAIFYIILLFHSNSILLACGQFLIATHSHVALADNSCLHFDMM